MGMDDHLLNLNEISYDKVLGKNNPFKNGSKEFDFRGCRFVTPPVVSSLASGIYWLNENFGPPRIILDSSPGCLYLRQSGLISLVSEIAQITNPGLSSNDEDSMRRHEPHGGVFQVLRVDNHTPHSDILATIDCFLGQRFQGSSEDYLRILTVISEISENICQHNPTYYGFIALQYYPNARMLELGVADCGRGIRSSLSENPAYSDDRSDLHSIQTALHHKATRFTVTEDPTRGTGLASLDRISKRFHATIQVRSGTGAIRFTYGETKVGQLGLIERYFYRLPWLPGTHIALKFPLTSA
jgi:hypothetical protein